MDLQISFDLWKTLIVSHPLYKRSRVELFHNFVLERFDMNVPIDFIANKIRGNELYADTLMEQGGIQYPTDLFLLQLVKKLAVGRAVSYSDIDELKMKLQALIEEYPPKLIDGVEETLSLLRSKHIPMVLLSNTTMVNAWQMIRINDMWEKYLNHSFYSDREGICKPHPHFFNLPFLPLSEWHTSPIFEREDTITYHVGDNLITDGACINFGYKFIHVDQESTVRKIPQLLGII